MDESFLKLEKKKLDNLSKTAVYVDSFQKKILNKTLDYCNKYFNGGNVLIMGASEHGYEIDKLIDKFEKIDVIEGSSKIVKNLKLKYKNINAKDILFEEFNSDKKYDLILMMHILEHVEDPDYILKKYSKFLEKNGKIIIIVPNANSFHRLLGVEMELIKSQYDLTEGDLSIGHKRVFDYDSIKKCILNSNLKILEESGILFKILPNSQLEKINLNKFQLNGLFNLGNKFMYNSSELLFVCGIN